MRRAPGLERRFYWACSCGAPLSDGMRAGPQYLTRGGAAGARYLHSRHCDAWCVVVESAPMASVPSGS